MMARDEFADHSWVPFIEATATRGPLEYFQAAMRFVDGDRGADRLAIDLGCGGGADTRDLLSRGWRVVAVDAEPEARRVLEMHTPDSVRERLTVVIGAFHTVVLPEADLVFAQFSLPFAGEHFRAAIANALGAVAPGGAFVGQFLAAEDDWAADPAVAVVDRPWIDRTFTEFDVLEIDERKRHGPSGTLGETKHWHFFDVRARR